MVTLQTSGNRTRTQVATFLRSLADEIDQKPEMDTETADIPTRIAALGDRESPSPSQTASHHADKQTENPGGNTTGLQDGEKDDDAETHTDSEDASSAATRAERITFISGGDSVTVSLPPTIDVGVTVKSQSPMFRSGTTQQIRVDLSWNVLDPDSHHDDGLQIE